MAQEYRAGSIPSLKRNVHLHDCDSEDIKNQDLIDAVLCDFINFLANRYGIDYGIHAYDIYWPEALERYGEIWALKEIDLVKYESELVEWERVRQQKRKAK
jgi:hypothetical protein